MAAPVTIDALNEMSRVRFVGALGTIFDYAPWVAETA